MTAPNPEHFLLQAKALIGQPGQRRPRQVDLRRAVSATYYAVFHATLAALADHFAGVAQRQTARQSIPGGQREAFLTLLLCRPRP